MLKPDTTPGGLWPIAGRATLRRANASRQSGATLWSVLALLWLLLEVAEGPGRPLERQASWSRSDETAVIEAARERPGWNVPATGLGPPVQVWIGPRGGPHELGTDQNGPSTPHSWGCSPRWWRGLPARAGRARCPPHLPPVRRGNCAKKGPRMGRCHELPGSGDDGAWLQGLPVGRGLGASSGSPVCQRPPRCGAGPRSRSHGTAGRHGPAGDASRHHAPARAARPPEGVFRRACVAGVERSKPGAAWKTIHTVRIINSRHMLPPVRTTLEHYGAIDSTNIAVVTLCVITQPHGQRGPGAVASHPGLSTGRSTPPEGQPPGGPQRSPTCSTSLLPLPTARHPGGLRKVTMPDQPATATSPLARPSDHPP